MGVNCQEVHFFQRRAQRSLCVLFAMVAQARPGVEWSYCWQLFDGLAGHTGLDQKLNVFVETRPPDMAPSQCFHPRYAGVITVVIYAYIYEASLVRKIYFHKMFSMAKPRKLCTSKICHYTVYYKPQCYSSTAYILK